MIIIYVTVSHENVLKSLEKKCLRKGFSQVVCQDVCHVKRHHILTQTFEKKLIIVVPKSRIRIA